MPVPPMGNAALPELQGAPALDRARFIARQRAAGLRWEQVGALLGVSGQRAGQLLKRYGHDPEIQALRDIGSAIKLQRKGIAALAELVELGLNVAREASADPNTERKEKASIVAAAVQPAHRLVEGSERVLKRYGIGAIEKPPRAFDHASFLDAVAVAIERIKALPPEAQAAAKEALRDSIHGKPVEREVIDVEAMGPDPDPIAMM